jgi:hypothetical protein
MDFLKKCLIQKAVYYGLLRAMANVDYPDVPCEYNVVLFLRVSR